MISKRLPNSHVSLARPKSHVPALISLVSHHLRSPCSCSYSCMTKRIRRQPMLATNTNGSIRSRSSQLPRFPLEISETVIDACAQFPNAERDVKDVYSCLCASALTCRAWYPRARLQLYDHVKITGSIQFEKLLRTLLASPSHGDFVHRLSIAVDPMGPGRFLSAGVVFVALCSKLRMLDRIDIIYTPVRPHVSFFVSLRAAQYRTVTILSLSGYSFSSIKDLIKYITSFPELRRLKVVQDDYDPPQPSQLRQALYVVNLPRLTTLQTELRHATNGPCSSTHIATHLIDWLTKSPTARHLRQIWIIYTVELSDEDHGAATRIDSLLKASGDSLQELVLAVQITSEVKEIWKVNLFSRFTSTPMFDWV